MKTITNILITHAVFLALFAGAAFAFAQEDVTNSPSERRAEIEANIEERRTEMQTNEEERRAEFASTSATRREGVEEKIAERRVQLQVRAQERITNLAANMSNRMDAAIARLNNITTRLETRIDKLSKDGVDTTTATETITSAQLSIATAAELIASIDTKVAAAVNAEDARAGWNEVKIQYGAIRDHIKTAHSELRATVTALKEAVQAADYGNGASEAIRQNNDGTTINDEKNAESQTTDETGSTTETTS